MLRPFFFGGGYLWVPSFCSDVFSAPSSAATVAPMPLPHAGVSFAFFLSVAGPVPCSAGVSFLVCVEMCWRAHPARALLLVAGRNWVKIRTGPRPCSDSGLALTFPPFCLGCCPLRCPAHCHCPSFHVFPPLLHGWRGAGGGGCLPCSCSRGEPGGAGRAPGVRPALRLEVRRGPLRTEAAAGVMGIACPPAGPPGLGGCKSLFHLVILCPFPTACGPSP